MMIIIIQINLGEYWENQNNNLIEPNGCKYMLFLIKLLIWKRKN
jgi:hypothetical protein